MKPRISLVLMVTLLLTITSIAGAKKEYFTQDELDIIREAQDLKDRVPAYLDLAERRLVVLGVASKSEQELEKERKDQELRDKQAKKTGPKAPITLKPPDDLGYLRKVSRADLLRGYIQALDEVMDNIDNAYSIKLDVRGPVENLEKFTRESLPVLGKFEPKNDAEKAALQDATDKAKEANEGAKDALKKVPKTEKKPTAPNPAD